MYIVQDVAADETEGIPVRLFTTLAIPRLPTTTQTTSAMTAASSADSTRYEEGKR
jgi:hypothetical protein